MRTGLTKREKTTGIYFDEYGKKRKNIRGSISDLLTML